MTMPASPGPSSWSSAAHQTRTNATPPGGSSKPSPRATPGVPTPEPARDAPGPISARCSWPATHSSMSSEHEVHDRRSDTPDRSLAFALNRRAFLGRYAGAIGHAGPVAPARPGEDSCAGATGRLASDVTRWEGERRAKATRTIGDLPVPARRARARWTCSTPSRRSRKHHGKPYPGQLEIHFDKQAGKLLASPFRFQPHGQSGMVLQRAGAAHGSDRRRPDAGPLDDDRLGRSRDGLAADPHRQDPGRPADLGLVGRLRAWGPRTRTCRPTWSCPTPAACRSTASATGRAAGCRRSTRGRRSARATRRCSTSRRRPGVTAEARACQLRFLDELNRSPPEAPSGRHRARGADRQLRDRRRDADGRPRGARPLARIGGHPADVRPGQPGHARVRHPLPDRPPPGRARRAVRPALPERPAVGHAQQERRDAQVALRPHRPAQRRSGPGPQTARAAGRDDRALDGRVRPAAGLAGHRRPRPQPPRLLALAGRRRVQAAATSTARPTSSATRRSRTS